MHDKCLEGSRIRARLGDHLLEYRALVIGSRCPRLDVFHRYGVPLSLTPFPDLPYLVRYGEIHLGLSSSGNTSI
jgi:hypothetical protein